MKLELCTRHLHLTHRWFLSLTLLGVLLGSVACGEDLDPDSVHEEEDTSLPNPDAGAPDGDTHDPDADAEEDADRRPPPTDGGDWEFEDDLGLTAVIPARGPLAGGTPIRLEGSGLGPEVQIFFDDLPLDTTFEGGQLTALTPPAEATGPVTVRAFALDGTSVELVNGFTYANPLHLESVSPSVLPTTGGIEISAHGQGFTEGLRVNVGGRPAPRVTILSGDHLRFVAPPHPAGSAEVELVGPDASATFDDTLRYFDELEITSLAPASGPTAGGQLVAINADGLTADTEATLGGRPALVESIDLTTGTLTLRTPAASSAGPADLLLVNDLSAALQPDAYHYTDATAPALLGLSPAAGSTAGGTLISVAGVGLDHPDARLRIGGQLATLIDAGPHHALATTPPGAPGAADVTLLHGTAEIDTLVEAFDYLPALGLTAVEPARGPASGGTTVTLRGEGLDQVTSVDFGGLAASFEHVDSTTLRVTTPAALPATVDVRVRYGQTRAMMPDAYTFVGEPQIWSFSPARGAIAGGTFVTLQGQGFDGDLTLRVGNAEALDLQRVGPNTLTFRTPPNAAGPHPIELRAAGQNVAAPYPFGYFNPLSNFGGASGAEIQGAVNVTVLTQGGDPIPGAFVMLSTRADTPYSGRTNANGQVTLSGPDVLGAQVVTATAPTFSTTTVHQVDAENLTLILNPIDPGEGEGGGIFPPLGYIKGRVSVTGKDSDLDASLQVNLTRVRTTRNALTGATINPGLFASITGGEGRYEIRTRTGDMALVAFCGHWDADAEIFTPLFMGIERYLFVADGDALEVDLECNIPLNKELGVNLIDPVFAPDGPNENRVVGYVNLGFEGFIQMPNPVYSLDHFITLGALPPAEGVLSDATYAVLAGSYRSSGVPYTQTAIEDISPEARSISTEPLVAVPRPVSPAPGGVVTNGELRLGLDGVNPPDFFYIVARNALGLPVWTFVVPGHERVVRLPQLPDFSDLPAEERPEPYQPGPLYVVAYGIRTQSFDFDQFSYRDFSSERWKAFSVSTWEMRLSDD
ncbi:IPT/TIG domain-containing protein [Lujinxingia litoralis]|uniref:IPT/TIG domain-containing protein n=1 Tax=Lujinxingia litoralis TaxID=2211119 RepID=UPI0011B940EB|nr:IPT/TIG domain-containing protein [Lujinxingia litoralis]